MIHIYTGEGKGKTTASVGLCVRAKSRGLRVLFIQFMKTDPDGGEAKLLEEMSVVVKRYDQIKSPHFYPEVDIQKMRETAEGILDGIKGEFEGYDLVVIDEFNNLVRTGILDEDFALALMKEFPERGDLVLTGRGATERMIKEADYVTYMDAVKHPLGKGMKAREGIEY